jgi:hypothetical protein
MVFRLQLITVLLSQALPGAPSAASPGEGCPSRAHHVAEHPENG